MRSPVDIHLAVVQPVAPFAQRGRRQMQRGGVLPHAHPAPVHRLDVHRPERLDRAIAHVRAHAKTKAGAPLPALFLSLAALLTTQFRLIFRMLASRFLAGQVAQPATERCRRQTMLTAILRPARARSDATLRCESATRIAAPCSRNVSNSPELLHVAKEPDMPRNCTTQSGCRDRTLTVLRSLRWRIFLFQSLATH